MKNLAGIKVMILGDESGAIRAMTEVDKRAGRLSTSLQHTGKMMIGLGTGVLTALAAGTLAMGNNAEEIMKQAQQVGMGAEDYQRFKFAVEQAGGSAENLTKGMTVLRQASVNAVGGNKMARAAFHELNVEFQNADGSARNTKDIILDLSDALAKGSKSPEQMAAALTLLGRRGGKELVMWLLEGRDAILATAAAAPGVIKEETLERLKNFQDRVKGMKTALIGLASEGLAPLIPYFDKAINWVMNLADRFEALSPETKKQIGQFILLGAVGLVAAGALFALGGVFTGLAAFTSPLSLKILVIAIALDTVYKIGGAVASMIGDIVTGIGKLLSHVPGLEKLINIGSRKAGGAGNYTFKGMEAFGQRMSSVGMKQFDSGLLGEAGNMVGGLGNKLFGGAAPGVAPPPTAAPLLSLIGGASPMPLLAFGGGAVGRTGQNINLNVNVDTASDAVSALQDLLGEGGID